MTKGDYQLLQQSEVESLSKRVDFSLISGKSILITGASGMVGSFTTEAIYRCCEFSGYSIPNLTLLVRNMNSSNLAGFNEIPEIDVQECDLQAWSSSENFDFLIHAASPASPTKYGNTREIFDSNLGFLERLNNSGLPTRSLLISSGEVYGSNAPVPVPESFVNTNPFSGPRADYPLAKLAAEEFLMSHLSQGKTEAVVARLFHSFGPGMKVDDGRSFADFLWAASRGESISLRSTGEDIRTFLYLEDATAAILSVLLIGDNGNTYNIGSTVQLSIKEFANLVGDLSGVEVKQHHQSLQDNYIHSPNPAVVPDTKKLQNIGWRMQVALDEGINRTLAWAGKHAKHSL